MKRQYALTLVLVLVCVLRHEAFAVPRHVHPETVGQNTRELFKQSMDLDEELWDNDFKLIKDPTNVTDPTNESHVGLHRVRESSWYALGLLLRDEAGDRQRASSILDAVLKQQYVTPGVPWYGTFRRTPEEPDPVSDPVIWKGYDPNWREFIGTTFAIILIEYPERISPELSQRLYASIDRSIEGEIHQGRLVPSYSNVALMYGFMWDFAAIHDKRPDWQKQSVDWTENVYQLFHKYDAFFEYNSPTYYGIDMYGLALWRDYGSTMRMRAIGSEMEVALWKDIASFYNPDLRNLSGPYDRAYGMDMESYVSVVGVWMRTLLDAQRAPLPKITASTDHVADIWLAPHLAILGTQIPPDALKKVTRFQGEHLVHKQITEQRVATAWIGHDLMYGGEATSKTKDAGTTTQFHPATIQWHTPKGTIGWVRLVKSPMVDSSADKHGLTILTKGTVRLRVHTDDELQQSLTATKWLLPGLRVLITSDAKNFRSESAGDSTDLIYSGMTRMRLEIEASSANGDSPSRQWEGN